jgi:hypothetical protein
MNEEQASSWPKGPCIVLLALHMVCTGGLGAVRRVSSWFDLEIEIEISLRACEYLAS